MICSVTRSVIRPPVGGMAPIVIVRLDAMTLSKVILSVTGSAITENVILIMAIV